MNLTAEQIKGNWDSLMSRIDAYIAEPRRSQLKEFYNPYTSSFLNI